MSTATMKAAMSLTSSALIGLGATLLPGTAEAHVKWFAAYDVMEAPRGMSDVLTAVFVALGLATMAALWLGARIEASKLGKFVNFGMDVVFESIRNRTEAIVRGGTAVFFVAVFVAGGTILTPELRTNSDAIPWLQAAIALGMVSRPTMALSGLGIVFLFGLGVSEYGLFHMMDYPIFLGAAAYLIMTGLRIDNLAGLRPLDIARWGTAITLMWASVEKWAFPGWSVPVLNAHNSITMGLDISFVMVAAGMVEFGLSFALIWTKLVRRSAGLILLSMFLAAVAEFGKVDAIGHLMILVLLLVTIADDRDVNRKLPVLAPATFAGALAGTMCF